MTRNRASKRPRLRAHHAAALGVAVLAFAAAPSMAAIPQVSPVPSLQDDRLSDPGADPVVRFAQAAALGARLVRVDLQWNRVATRKPTDASSPSDPAYDWSWYDRVVAASASSGVPILFTVWGTPNWAADPTVSEQANAGTIALGSAGRRPASAADFGAFARAAATRYAPLGVHNWEAWNEPNIPRFLRPQFEKVGGSWKNVSAKVYSDLAKAFYASVKAVDPNAIISGLVTAPAGDKCPPSCPAGEHSRTSPIAFLNELATPGMRPPMDAVSHHPYPLTLPREGTFKGASFVDLYNIDFLTKAVDKTYLKGKPLWLTEFGFATEPVADYKKLIVSQNQQAALLSDAYRRVRTNPRVRVFTWYFLQDGQDWRSGLYNRDGGPKLANAAYKLPFAAVTPRVRKGKSVFLVGQVRPTLTSTSVTIQARGKKGVFKVIKSLTTSNDGSFSLRVKPAPPTSYRAVWKSKAGETVTSFPVTITLDRGKKPRKKK